MGSGFLFLLFMVATAALKRGFHAGFTPKTDDQTLHDIATHAHAEAANKRRKAQQTGHPADAAAAAAAAHHAAAASQTLQAALLAKKTPAPWPQATPKGLPAFPAGWEPDEPPPQAVQTRAMQLLSSLWAKGAGAKKAEKTQGRWITYVATPMAAGKKGVVAYRVRADATTAASPAVV